MIYIPSNLPGLKLELQSDKRREEEVIFYLTHRIATQLATCTTAVCVGTLPYRKWRYIINTLPPVPQVAKEPGLAL